MESVGCSDRVGTFGVACLLVDALQDARARKDRGRERERLWERLREASGLSSRPRPYRTSPNRSRPRRRSRPRCLCHGIAQERVPLDKPRRIGRERFALDLRRNVASTTTKLALAIEYRSSKVFQQKLKIFVDTWSRHDQK